MSIELRVYGKTAGEHNYVKFGLKNPNDDRYLSTGPTFAAGDCQIRKDRGSWTNTTNLPVNVTGGVEATLQLVASEMQAETVSLKIIDQTSPGQEWADVYIVIHTVGHQSAFHNGT